MKYSAFRKAFAAGLTALMIVSGAMPLSAFTDNSQRGAAKPERARQTRKVNPSPTPTPATAPATTPAAAPATPSTPTPVKLKKLIDG